MELDLVDSQETSFRGEPAAAEDPLATMRWEDGEEARESRKMALTGVGERGERGGRDISGRSVLLGSSKAAARQQQGSTR